MKPIKLQIGCTYYLRVKPIGTDGKTILPQTITDPVFRVAGTKTVYPHTIDGEFFCLTLPATEIEGVYDMWLTGKIGTDDYQYAWNDLWERSKYSDAIEYSTYHTCCVIVGYSDAELEAAKQAAEQARQDYLQAAAEAVQAKEDYIAKAEQLDGVAKESTSQSILSKLDAIHIDLTPVLNKLSELKTWLGGQFTTLQSWIETKLGTVAKEATLNEQSQAIKNKIDAIDIDTSTLATLENQQKMMVNFGMSEGMPEMVALTDNEILTTYQAPDTGIADTTYGHRQPVEVTIDDIDLTCYQERTYADYGYSALYDADGNPYAVTNHPQEGDQLYTTND